MFLKRLTIFALLTTFVVLGSLTPATGLAASTSRIIYEGSIDSSDLDWIQDEAGTGTLAYPGSQPVLDTDLPQLPSLNEVFLVPMDARIVAVEVVPEQTHRETLPGRITLNAPIRDENGVEARIEMLSPANQMFPAGWSEFGGTHAWRGYRLAAVRIFPVRAIADEDGNYSEIEVLDRYSVRLVTGDGGVTLDPIQRERLVPGERDRNEAYLRKICANPEAVSGYSRFAGVTVAEAGGGFQPTRTPSLSGSHVSYLIITDDAMEAEFQRLADFKTAQGIPAVVTTMSWIAANCRNGADVQETIRLFIKDAYARWGVEFVLLGGDTDVVPARYVTNYFYPPTSSTDIPVDIYFSCLDGNWNFDGDSNFAEIPTGSGDQDYADLISEIYLGRAPVSSVAAAESFVDKVITYQSTAAPADPEESIWTNRNLFAAEVLFFHHSGEISLDGAEFAHEIINDYIIPCTSMEYFRMYETDELYPWDVQLTREALIDTLNNGRYGIVNQIGHGYYYHMSVADANFTSADADALVNGDHLFMIFAMNCCSGAFDYSCLLERFVQNPNGGSVASVGSSRVTYPDIAAMFEMHFYDQLYCQNEPHIGIIQELSRLPYEAFAYSENVYRWTYLANMYLGDPALPIWTGNPRAVEVTAPVLIAGGEQLIDVTVSVESTPVEGALVCLAKDGDDYVYGVTDVAGSVSLPFTPTQSGDATLTVTGWNLELTQSTITVVPGTSYIAVASVSVDDSDGGLTTGNDNSAPEAGETVSLLAYVSDTGGAGATGCTATLTCTTPGVTIVDDTAYIGTVAPGAQDVAAQDEFLIAFDTTFTDGDTADLLVTVEDDGLNVYETEVPLTVSAPEVEVVGLDWSDTLYGNDDGVLDDDERVTLSVTLKNFGVGLADEIDGVLGTDDPSVTLYDTEVTFTDIGLVGTSTGGGDFSLAQSDGSAQAMAYIEFTDNYGRNFRHDFHLQRPTAPEELLTDSSQGSDIIVVSWEPPETAGVRGYHLYRSLDEAGPFTRVNTDLLDGMSYFRDDGLELLTPYYYQAATVDSSLVPSEASAIVMQSTSPAEIEGFPIPFGIETSSHCAVADVNGDGMNEVILAADNIYTFTADGSELFNGDNDGLTIGPFTDLWGRYEPAGITLANLDGGRDLEIIASERDNGNDIWVYKADGTVLDGWPQALAAGGGSHWNWSTPAVGDIDGDGEEEIAVTANNGITYVFNDDGTEMIDGDANPGTHGYFVQVAGNWNFGSPAVCDLDHDGAKDVIIGSRATTNTNSLHVKRHDLSNVDGFPYGGDLGRIQCAPAVADLNDDGVWEIIFYDLNRILYVVQEDGSDYPGFPMSYTAGGDTAPGASPAVGNFDGDTDLEIVWVSNVHGDRADILVVDTEIGGATGTIMDGWPQIIPGGSEGSPVVGDIDGDGVQDIIHGIGGASTTSPNNLYAFKADGASLAGFPITLNGPMRPSAVICDFDNDNDVDIIMSGGDRLVHVWDMPFEYNSSNIPWSTFHGNYKRDGVCYGKVLVPVAEDIPAVNELVVKAPYPNPFNPSTSITLFVPGLPGTNSDVRLKVYDVKGRRVRTLFAGPVSAGWHTWVWDGRDNAGKQQASGIYFLRAASGGKSEVHKMSLIK